MSLIDPEDTITRAEFEARHAKLETVVASLADSVRSLVQAQLHATEDRSELYLQLGALRGWIQGATIIGGILMAVTIAALFHTW